MADYYIVSRRGQELYRDPNEVRARDWLHSHQPHSIWWATEHEGYQISPVVIIR
jgi:hypothetical protein